MAKMGVRAEGGPQDGQYLDASGLLIRTVRGEGGWYHLRGKADGSLVYIWADLASLDTQPA